jgi:subtilisin family serine protease
MPRNHRLAVRATALALLVVASTMFAGVSLGASTPGGPPNQSVEASQPVEESEQASKLLGLDAMERLGDSDQPILGTALERDLENESHARAIIIFEEQPDVAKIRQQTSSQSELVRTLKTQTEGVQSNTMSTLSQLQTNGEVKSYDRYWLVNAISLQGSEAAIEKLREQPNVAAIVKDERVRIPGRAAAENTDNPLGVDTESQLDTSNSSDYGSSPGDNDSVAWGVERIDADDAQAKGYTGDGARVAVIDTGVDPSHPDLKGSIAAWKDFVSNRESPYDDNMHGTHVAGTVAGDGSGGLQTGVAPDADIIAAKALNGAGSGYISDIVAAVQWSVAQDADVISMSLGGTESEFFALAMDKANSAGAIPVVSAGNLPSTNSLVYPTNKLLEVGYPGVASNAITVGATNALERRTYFSAYQTDSDDVKPEVVAPGSDIESTLTRHGDATGRALYKNLSGTSMSAPHVSGLAALVIAERPETTLSELETLLKRTSVDMGPSGTDDKFGFGRIDANAALIAVDKQKTVTTAVTTTDDGDNATINVTVTDGEGTPIPRQEVNVTVLSDSVEQLEVAKQNANKYVYDDTVTTDQNGTATVTVQNITNKTAQRGDFAVEAAVDGGLWTDAASFTVGQNVDVTITSDRTSYQSGDNATLTVTTTRNGSPVNASVNLTVLGPTGRVTSDMASSGAFEKTVTTGDSGATTTTVELPRGWVINYIAQGYVPGYGQYDVQANTTSVNGTNVSYEAFESDLFTFQQEYTDVSFDTQQGSAGLLQQAMLSERIEIGSTQTVELETTNPNTEYEIRLFKGFVEDRGYNLSGATVDRQLATVTTDENGDASVDVTVPEDLPGGNYMVTAAKAGTNLSAISGSKDVFTEGGLDTGFVQIEAVEIDIELETAVARDDTFQVGDQVHVRAEFRNASTGELAKQQHVKVESNDIFRLTNVANPEPGVYEGVGQVLDRSRTAELNVFPEVTVAGTDQNGGTFGDISRDDDGGGGTFDASPFARITNGPSETKYAAFHEVHVTYNKSDIEPGESVEMTFHVSDRSSGEPVEHARIETSTLGFNNRHVRIGFFPDTWTQTTVAKTGDDGTASIVVDVPSHAGEYLNGFDVSTQYRVVKGDLVTRGLVTGTDLEHPSTRAELPDVELSLEGAADVTGRTMLTQFEPGETINLSVSLQNIDAAKVPARDRSLDVYVEKISQFGRRSGGLDLLESESSGVYLNKQGNGTFTYEIPEDAEPGALAFIVQGQLGGRPIAGQLDSRRIVSGIVAEEIDVNAPQTATAGEEIAVNATAPVNHSADVDFYVKRVDEHGNNVYPTMVRSDASAEQYYRTLGRFGNSTRGMAAQFVDRLPDSAVQNESKLEQALAGHTARLLMQSARLRTASANQNAVSGDSRAVQSGTLGTSLSLPENAPPGEYRIVAVSSSEQLDGEAQALGSTTLTVRSGDRQRVTETLELQKGWNLVSLPADTKLSVSELKNRTDGTVLKTVTMTEDGYKPVETLSSDTAYWVFTTEDASVSVTGYRIGERTYETDEEWQLVGGLSDAASIADSFKSPTDLQVQFVTWDTEASEYTVVDEVDGGDGYWVVANGDGSITLMTPPSSPSSSDTENESVA